MCSAFRLISQLPGNDFPAVNNWKEGLTDFQLWFRTAVIQYLYNCVFKSGARDDLFSFLVFAYIFKCYSFDCDDSSKGFDFEGIPLRELPTHVFDDHLLIESVCNRIYFCFLFYLATVVVDKHNVRLFVTREIYCHCFGFFYDANEICVSEMYC